MINEAREQECAECAELKTAIKRLEAEAQVARDLHAALGVRWGEDPYVKIKKQKRYRDMLKECSKLLRNTYDLWLRGAEHIDEIIG